MANLFSDGFEGGNLNAWSSAVTDGGNLSATTAAKLHGNYGLSCLINDTNHLYVQDDTPTAEKRYRLRFYFDPNNLSMAHLSYLSLMQGNDSATVFVLYLTYSLSYETNLIWINVRRDDTSEINGSKYAITDAPHCIEIDWKASSGAGNNNGTIELIIDGVSKETLTGIDNDTRTIEKALFGTFSIGGGTISGTIFLDDFQSNNDGTSIGLLFEYSGIGTLTYSGTATQVYTNNYLYTGSGSLAYSGSAIISYLLDFLFTGSGTFAFSGIGLYELGLSYIGSGEFAYSGAGTCGYGWGYVYVGTGIFAYLGIAIQSYTFNYPYYGTFEIIANESVLSIIQNESILSIEE